MRSLRFIAAIAFLLPTFAQAATLSSSNIARLSRASFVEMVMTRVGAPQNGSYCFSDVKNEAFAPSVCSAKSLGFVTGASSGKFRPYDSITFVEAAAVAIRAAGQAVQSDSLWYRPYITLLSDLDAFPSSVTNIFHPITPAQADDLLTGVLNGNSSRNNSGNSHSSSNNADTTDDDVHLTVTASDTSADIDDVVTYTIKVRNDDTRDLRNVRVRAYIDRDFDFVSATDGGDYDSDRVEWDDIDIDEDDTESVELKVRVSDGAQDGDSLNIRVTVEDSTVRKTLKVDEGSSHSNDDNEDVSVTISDSPSTAEPGDTVTYTIRLRNDGNSDERVDVRAMLDHDMTFVSASDDGEDDDDEVTWDRILVREDESETLTLKVRIDSSAQDGDTVRLEVEADGEEDTETTNIEDDGNSNNTTNDDDVSIAITDSEDPVEVGDIVTYTIRLSNKTNDDQYVDVVATLDIGMTIYTSSDRSERNAKEIRWRDLRIPADDDRVVNIKVRVNSYVDDGDTIKLRVRIGDAREDETTEVQ